jgi:hypothetical protein
MQDVMRKETLTIRPEPKHTDNYEDPKVFLPYSKLSELWSEQTWIADSPQENII